MRIADDIRFAERLDEARLKTIRYGNPYETDDDDTEAQQAMCEAVDRMNAYAVSLHKTLQTNAEYQSALNTMTQVWICFSASLEDDSAGAYRRLDNEEAVYLASIDGAS